MSSTFEQIKIRSMAAVDAWMYKTGQPNWSKFTLRSAVKDGYESNGWVYRAISLISRNGASAPWHVVDAKTNEPNTEHPIHKLINRPNSQYSRQDMFELIISWRQLVGKAFLKRVFLGSKTVELWPISPDRIAPVGSTDPGELIKGYGVIDEKGTQQRLSGEYTNENVIYFRAIDPSDPIGGIGPLQAAARAVDVDNEQQDWNKSAMENRGVFDGVFTFKQNLSSDQHQGIVDKMKERLLGKTNARLPAVIGSDAKYTRLSVTPAEMDFLKSREFNRDEIYTILGVPPQLAGSTEAVKYDNFRAAMRIFWVNTLIPLLDDLADTLNLTFYDELGQGQYLVAYDTSGIAALSDSEDDKVVTSEKYWKMGVPFESINSKMNLGFEEFEGWDLPWGGAKAPIASGKEVDDGDKRYWSLIPLEQRSLEDEQKRRDYWAEKIVVNTFNSLLGDQLVALNNALDQGVDDPISVVSMDGWSDTMRGIGVIVAVDMAGTITIGERGRRPKLEKRDEFDDDVAALIDQHMEDGEWLETEVRYIEEFTIGELEKLMANAEENGMAVQQIKNAIQDMGVFSEARALRLARTLAGTASSIGQLSGAEVSGAEFKEWVNSEFEVRETHIARNGERVGINETFSDQGCGAPQYPLAPNLCPADRVNCRCSMVFM